MAYGFERAWGIGLKICGQGRLRDSASTTSAFFRRSKKGGYHNQLIETY